MRLPGAEASSIATRYYGIHMRNVADSTMRLSTGKILLKDNPVAVIISSRLRMQLRRLHAQTRITEAQRGETDAQSDRLQNQRNLLTRMQELATQMGNGALSQNDRDTARLEYEQLAEEYAQATEKGTGMKIVAVGNGSVEDELFFKKDGRLFVGGEWMEFDDYLARLKEDALRQAEEPGDSENPGEESGLVGKAIEKLDLEKEPVVREISLGDHVRGLFDGNLSMTASVGATAHRLSEKLDRLFSEQEIAVDALSRTEDVDMAEEIMHFLREKMLGDVAAAVATQANALPEQVLTLLQGVNGNVMGESA